MNEDLFKWYEKAHDVLLGLQKENPQSEGLKSTIENLKNEIDKMKSEIPKEILAHMELKRKIVKLMFDFIDKYTEQDSPESLYPITGYILVDVLTSCLNEAQYQVNNYQPFTSKQIDHICYQIGEWYLMMKALLEGQHNLGYMKEKLKTMICGE